MGSFFGLFLPLPTILFIPRLTSYGSCGMSRADPLTLLWFDSVVRDQRQTAQPG